MSSYKEYLTQAVINEAILEFDQIGKNNFIEKYGFENEELYIEQDNYKYPLVPLIASRLNEDIMKYFLEESRNEIISYFQSLNIEISVKPETYERPGKHGQKWTMDDKEYLDELWQEGYFIEEIADVLERSHFSIVCQLVYRKKVNLSSILEKTKNHENIERAVDFYISEREDLVDIENEYVTASREKIKEAKLIKKIEKSFQEGFTSKTTYSNNLERLVYEILEYPKKEISGREIRNYLVFIKAITNLFPSEERDIFFTVNPKNGENQKTFKEAALELNISEFKVKQQYGYALRKLQLLLPNADVDLKNNLWIQVEKQSRLQLFFNNKNFTVPQVSIDPTGYPLNLSTVDDLKLPQSICNKLKSKGIFTVFQLEGKRYPDLRFGYELDEQTSQEVIVAIQYHLKKIADQI